MRKSLWSGLLPSIQLVVMLAVAGCSDGSITVTNSPPSAVIEAPSIGTEAFEGAEVLFRGVVEDRSTVSSELIVTWSSSLDGELMSGNADSDGVTEFATTELSGGIHTITLQVRDSGGAAANATLDLVVREDAAPSITIVSPTAEGVYYSDLPVTLQASVNDAEDEPEALLVSWAVDGGQVLATDLPPDSTGLTTGSTTLDGGTYVLVATVTDTAERTATATVTIVVGPPNTAPTCEITAPASLSTVPLGELVLLEGTVADVDVPADWLEVTFESNVDSTLGTATPSTAGEVALGVASLTAATHTVTMTVADEVGGTCSDFIVLTVSTPPSATITTPTSGDPLNVGDTLTLSGIVSDVEDADDSLVVSWESDIDGALGSPSPDSSGAVALNFSLTAGPHLLTLTATDSAGLTGTDTVTVSVNTTPTAPVVSISPTAPNTTDDLTVIIDTASTDADGAPSALSYSYAWTRGGNAQGPFSPPESVPAAQTSREDVWEVTVTATDGQASSAGATAQVMVGNSTPSLASATFSPALGVNGTTFTVTPSGWSDPDAGDSPGYSYQWVAGGSPVANEVSATYTAAGLASGSQIYCEVTPFDGTIFGVMVVSSPALLNSLPVVAGVSISPTSATESTPLSASYTSTSDADASQTVTVSWQWNRSGSPIAGATNTSLTGADFDSGDSITVTATPNDTLEDGLPVTSIPVVIDNSPPSMTSVNITPTIAYTDTTLTANPVGWSDPDPADSTPAYMYEWFAGANPVGGDSTTLPGSEFVKGDLVTVQVTPNDAHSSGTPVTSAGITILNSAPTISSVSIVPAPAYSIDTLTCSYTGYADLDGDPDASTFNWTVNGAPAGTASTLAGSFAAGDTVVCTVTPFDGTLQGALDTATTTIASPPCPLVVETTGTSTGVGSAARPFGTLQAAVDATALGSCLSIDLGPGEYVESVNLADRNVVIVGRDGPAWTVLRAVSGRALSISGGQSSACSVSGITFTGGRCLGIGNGSSPVIRDNVFDACTSSGSGAAIGIGGGANPEIFDNDFDSNVSSNGGAISVTGGASPHIHDNDFSDNSAVNGGAIYNSGGAALIQNNDFIDNDASQKGGAVSNHSGSSTSILGNYFRRNQGQWGGGVHCHGSNLTMSSNTYSSNSPSSNYCSPTCSGCSNN